MSGVAAGYEGMNRGVLSGISVVKSSESDVPGAAYMTSSKPYTVYRYSPT